jgi:tryptophan synthase beta chain
MSKDQIIIVNLSGRGDKDVAEAARHIFGEDLKF